MLEKRFELSLYSLENGIIKWHMNKAIKGYSAPKRYEKALL